VSPSAFAPYFMLAALVHLAGIATRFDVLAAKLPPVVGPALMVAQFPLLVLSGYFESRIEYEETNADFPLWMKIKSKPVKLAFTFAFIYIALVPLQTWDVSIGPLDPTPPLSFPLQQRAMWFSMFTVGMFFPFYLAATGALVPVLRIVTWPLRLLPPVVAGLAALLAGGGLGVVVLALVSSQQVGAFVGQIRDAYRANPAIGLVVSALALVVPYVIGLVRGRDEAGA
jgi:hypothetical protein